MSEAVEWRLAALAVTVKSAVGGLLLVIGYIGIVAAGTAALTGIPAFAVAFASATAYVLGFVAMFYCLAKRKNGYSRQFFSLLGILETGDEADPPLEEWKDDLEDRGAFSVSESDYR